MITGKKYTGKVSGAIYECIFADKEGAYIKGPNGRIAVSPRDFMLYYEYFEPRERWIVSHPNGAEHVFKRKYRAESQLAELRKTSLDWEIFCVREVV